MIEVDNMGRTRSGTVGGWIAGALQVVDLSVSGAIARVSTGEIVEAISESAQIVARWIYEDFHLRGSGGPGSRLPVDRTLFGSIANLERRSIAETWTLCSSHISDSLEVCFTAGSSRLHVCVPKSESYKWVSNGRVLLPSLRIDYLNGWDVLFGPNGRPGDGLRELRVYLVGIVASWAVRSSVELLDKLSLKWICKTTNQSTFRPDQLVFYFEKKDSRIVRDWISNLKSAGLIEPRDKNAFPGFSYRSDDLTFSWADSINPGNSYGLTVASIVAESIVENDLDSNIMIKKILQI